MWHFYQWYNTIFLDRDDKHGRLLSVQKMKSDCVFYIISISEKARWWLIKETIGLNCLKVSFAFKLINI